MLQLNVNSQEGLSLATAESGYVEVRSFQDPSDGNGIIAESTATATAALSQTAGQSNSNSATVTLPPRRWWCTSLARLDHPSGGGFAG